MIRPKFFPRWNEDVSADWAASGRKKLNEVIEAFNAWMRDAITHDRYAETQARGVLALIEEGLQTWATVDGGSDWHAQLLLMQEEVATRIPDAVNVPLHERAYSA